MSPEIRKRPIGFRHLGSSPFCEGESQTLKLPLTALFTQQTSVFGFVCSTKQKGLAPNLLGFGIADAMVIILEWVSFIFTQFPTSRSHSNLFELPWLLHPIFLLFSLYSQLALTVFLHLSLRMPVSIDLSLRMPVSIDSENF